MNSGARFVTDEYAFIVGPAVLSEPLDSQNVHEIVEYTIEEVLASLLALPNMRLLNGADARWTGWAAAWECRDRIILFENVQELGDWDRFGGIDLRCDCHVEDLLELWEGLRAEYSGLWIIGPDSWLHPPVSFAAQIPFDTCWQTSEVVAIACGIRSQSNYSAMPILADALQDAGCDNDHILNHCRDPRQTHICGCWVVDLVLGKS